MSGWCLIKHWDGSPVEHIVFDTMRQRLQHRGPDGWAQHITDQIALGYAHQVTTPEAQIMCQPLQEGPYTLVFNGRLDNRPDLLARLPDSTSSTPDAALILQGYLRYGEAWVEQLIGGFAFALYDASTHQVMLARDPLGARTLFYSRSKQYCIAASEPWVVCAHPYVSTALNEHTIAAYMAVRGTTDESTFFTDVKELRPGRMLRVGGGHGIERQYWQLDPEYRLHFESIEAAADQFLGILQTSVEARLRSVTAPTIMLSGGYDSGSVAALAAHLHDPVDSISWTFDGMPESDERHAIEMITAHCGIQPTYIAGEDFNPTGDSDLRYRNPNQPDTRIYRRLLMRMYAEAAAQGKRVLLAGGFGDTHHSRSGMWLVDLLQDGHMTQALTAGLRYLRRQGLQVVKRPTFWRLGAWALDRIPGGRTIYPGRGDVPPPWLTDHALSLLSPHEDEGWYFPPLHVQYYSVDRYFTSSSGIDMWHPYRDQRLAAFMAGLPAYFLFDGQRVKSIVYYAMRGLLPDTIRETHSTGRLHPLYEKGIISMRQALREDDQWQAYVSAKWLDQALARRHNPAWRVVLWRCVTLTQWLHVYNTDRRYVNV